VFPRGLQIDLDEFVEDSQPKLAGEAAELFDPIDVLAARDCLGESIGPRLEFAPFRFGEPMKFAWGLHGARL